MATEFVGTLVVVNGDRRPVGMLTDRDLMLQCVAEARDPDHTHVVELMTSPVVTVTEETPIEEALGKMARHAVRRIVVVNGVGQLAGILALDDVMELLSEEMEAIGRLLRGT